jgi:pSer/pThr/pTyr-binding forkhead associated (FHA) protein
VQIFHLRPRSDTASRTTTSIVPQRILRFRGADRAGKRYGFDVDVDKLITRRGGMVIGRDLGQCDIGLGHATVSRRHARLVFADGALRIEDLGSTNRTAIDGVALEAGKRKRLETGAVVKMGEVELKLGGE